MDDPAFYTEFVTAEHLVRRVTLDDYIARGRPRLSDPAPQEHELRQFYLTLFAEGDEWWEWQWGKKMQPFSEGGLALVRDGKVVWADADWAFVLNT